jgi:hypothetical protein
MILTKEQVAARVNSEKNIVNKQTNIVVFKDGLNHKGRGDSKNLTHEDRVNIGVLANLAGNDLTAEVFDISPNTARHLRTGQELVYEPGKRDEPRSIQSQELQEAIKTRLDNAKLTIEEKAAQKLLESMGLISTEKMENCSAKDLAQITNQMSQVVRNISGGSRGQDKGNGGASVKVVVMKPKTSSEDSYDVIEVGLGL